TDGLGARARARATRGRGRGARLARDRVPTGVAQVHDLDLRRGHEAERRDAVAEPERRAQVLDLERLEQLVAVEDAGGDEELAEARRRGGVVAALEPAGRARGYAADLGHGACPDW